MNSEQAKELTDRALTRLTHELERGNSESLTRYLTAMSRFHDYSFSNVMLICSQRPDATHVAGFATWKSLGRHVRKGEKGIGIVAPMIFRSRDRVPTSGDESGRDDDVPVRFRVVHVFDIEQTDGEPLPTIARVQGDPCDLLRTLKDHITGAGIRVVTEALPPGIRGYSAGGLIATCENMPPAEEFAVLVHELAHERLHHGTENVPVRRVRELEAEAVAFVVTHGVGLEVGSASADYIALYNGEASDLASSMERIRRTASGILSAVLTDSSVESAAAA